jgi:hypothetical protein
MGCNLGFKGIQMPTHDTRFIDLKRQKENLCRRIKRKIASYGLEITELSTHLQGQLVAVPLLMMICLMLCTENGTEIKSKARMGCQQLKYAAKASHNLGINAHATFSGSLLWQYFHPLAASEALWKMDLQN